MRFLCLGYFDEDTFNAEPEEVRNEIMSKCYAQCDIFRAAGTIVEERALQSTRRAKSIRPRNGRSTIMDGPFIETKEQLGSFFIIEANNIDEAVELASKHPAAMMGEQYGFGIEVRPIQ